eukprot:890175-Pleurochrysis_carterae.AAC.1
MGSVEVIQTLREAGAAVDAEGLLGLSPKDCARRRFKGLPTLLDSALSGGGVGMLAGGPNGREVERQTMAAFDRIKASRGRACEVEIDEALVPLMLASGALEHASMCD